MFLASMCIVRALGRFNTPTWRSRVSELGEGHLEDMFHPGQPKMEISLALTRLVCMTELWNSAGDAMCARLLPITLEGLMSEESSEEDDKGFYLLLAPVTLGTAVGYCFAHFCYQLDGPLHILGE
jgi:hypothetical protein